MSLFVNIVFVLITLILILVVLLQAGKGGGMGSALGGGASQGVFGGSGGADFMTKLTQGLAVGFMVCAVYLAYASTHTDSARLKRASTKTEVTLADAGKPVDYEAVGRSPQPLPAAGTRAAAEAKGPGVETPTDIAPSAVEPEAPSVGADDTDPTESPAADPTETPAETPAATPTEPPTEPVPSPVDSADGKKPQQVPASKTG